jgi:hypothetical protein
MAGFNVITEGDSPLTTFLLRGSSAAAHVPLMSSLPSLPTLQPSHSKYQNPGAVLQGISSVRHNKCGAAECLPCVPIGGKNCPTPPPKFAVFHKKFPGNSKLKVRPIQSAVEHVDENVIAELPNIPGTATNPSQTRPQLELDHAGIKQRPSNSASGHQCGRHCR